VAPGIALLLGGAVLCSLQSSSGDRHRGRHRTRICGQTKSLAGRGDGADLTVSPDGVLPAPATRM